MDNKLTYHYKPAIIKDDFLITDFGEVSIEEIIREYNNIIAQIRTAPEVIQDYDYLYELEAIVKQVNILKENNNE